MTYIPQNKALPNGYAKRVWSGGTKHTVSCPYPLEKPYSIIIPH